MNAMLPADADGIGNPVRYSWRDGFLAALVAMLLLLHAWVYAGRIPLGKPPDEKFHLTYVLESAAEGAWIPDYENSRLLPRRTAKNYLQHPPLYYTVLGAVGKVTGWETMDDFIEYRRVSAVLISAGLLLWLLVARSFGIAWRWILPLGLSVNIVPMFPYLAASVNNDSLAYLGVAIGVFGMANVRKWPATGWYILSLGLIVCLLTKANAGLFMAVSVAVWLALETRLSPKSEVFHSRHFWMAAALAVLPVAAYYLWIKSTHGSYFPRAGLLRTPAPPAGEVKDIAEIAWQFVLRLGQALTMVASHSPLTPVQGILRHALLATLMIPVVAMTLSQFGLQRDARGRIATAIFIGTVVTVLVHFSMVVRNYHHYGALAGLHPRYYLFLLPGLAILALASQMRGVRILMGVYAIAACAMLMTVPQKTFQAEEKKREAALAKISGSKQDVGVGK